MTKQNISIALLNQKVDYVIEKVTKIEDKLDGDYVTREEFDPIKKVVYGLVSLILTAVVVALISLVLRK